MKDKKVIFIHLLNDYSGSPKVLSQVINAVKKEYDVELFTAKSDDGFLSDLGVKHHFFFYKRFENKYLTLLIFMLSQMHLFFKLQKYKNEDVLIYVNTLLPFCAGLAGKFMGKNVYYHIHETSITPLSFKRFLRSMVSKTASKIFFVSNSLMELESFDAKEQSVIYNALPKELEKMALDVSYKHKHDGFFSVLMICSLKQYKGVDEFVSIAKKLKQNQNIRFTLLLNADKSEIDNYFKDKELPSNINIISKQKDVVPFYKEASLVLNLSRIDEWVETFGLTVLEAMAFGIPVIVPPVGGPAEIVRDTKDGYLLSSYDTKRIAKTIEQLASDEKLCLQLSKNAKQRAADFSEDVFEKNILHIFSSDN